MVDTRQTLLTAGTMLFGTLERFVPWTDQTESSGSRPDVFENSSDGYILLDDDGEVVETNAATTQLLGAGAVACGDDLAATLPALAALVDSPPQEETEFRPGADPDGQTLVARRVSLSADAMAETLVVVREQTAIRREEKRYRAFVEHSSELVFLLDSGGTARFAGPACRSVLGDSPANVVGTDLATKVHPEDQERFRTVIHRLVEDPETDQHFEFRIQTVDGEWRIVTGRGRNLLDDPVVDGILLTLRDVTDRKQREHDLERQNERLQKLADVLSHDLRNPLQVATLSLERAKRTGETDAFEKTTRAHDRIDTIIQNVLTLARQGQRISEPTTVTLAAVARDAWETVDTQSLTLSVDRDGEIEADRDRLQQLFENLFRNAAEHATPAAAEDGDPGASVTVGPIDPLHTATRVAAQCESGFYVADDGPGIPEDAREDVFEYGFTTEASGTGFGLAIVAEIAEAHRWEPTITDSRDGGARFEFTERPMDNYLRE